MEWIGDLYFWVGLNCCYDSEGIFNDVKKLIFSEQSEDAAAAYWSLENKVIVQGNIYDSGYAVSEIVCCLLRQATEVSLPFVLELLNQFVYCYNDDEKKCIRDCYKVSFGIIGIVLDSEDEVVVVLGCEILAQCFFEFEDVKGFMILKKIVGQKINIIKNEMLLSNLQNILRSDVGNCNF